MAEGGIDQWRKIVETFPSIRSRREAIVEFMRIDLTIPDVLNQSLSSYLRDDPEYNLKDIEPYNQADMYMLHCDMLVKFANIPEPSTTKQKSNKRSLKEKQKTANKLITEKLQQMREEMS